MASGGPSELLYKVLVVGEGGTGKTCIIRRYVHNIFQGSMKSTIGVDFALKVLTWDKSTNITLQIWDIAGQERYGQMTRVYYQAAVGALVVCDAGRPDTMTAAIRWKQDLDSKVFLNGNGANVPCVLLVNKVDVTANPKTNEEMDAFCQEHKFVGWFNTSAKEDKNISPAFHSLVESVLQATASLPAPAASENKTVVPAAGNKDKKKKDCAC